MKARLKLCLMARVRGRINIMGTAVHWVLGKLCEGGMRDATTLGHCPCASVGLELKLETGPDGLHIFFISTR